MNKRINSIRTKAWKNLTRSEIRFLRSKKVLNGFGGAGQSWISRYLIGLILADFDEAIPDMHDFGYWVGGNEARRLECDEKFYMAMLRDIAKRYDWGHITKFELVWKALVACMAYYAIRWKGKKFFNYL